MSTKEALSPADDTFRAMVEQLSEGILAVDLGGVITYCNPRMAKFLGMAPEELQGTSFIECLEPAARPFFFERMKIREEGQSETYELAITNKAGLRLLFAVSGTPLRDQAGQVLGAYATFRDITEKFRSEEILKENEAKFRNVFENMQDVFYRTDNEGRMVLMSPSAARVLGYDSVDELLGKSIPDFMYLVPSDHAMFMSALSEKGFVTGFEETLRKRDGTPVMISTSSHFYRDAEGRVLGVEGIFFDISQRKLAEQALQEKEAMYRALVEHSHDGIFIIEGDRFLFVNPRATGIVGHSQEELYGMNLWDLVHPEERAKVRENAERRIRGEAIPSNYHARILHKSGAVLSVELSLSKIPFGGRWAVLGTLRDVTERLESETALKNSEERYRLLVENQGEGVGYVDETERFLFVNHAAEEILGRPRADLLGRSLSDFTDFADFQKIQNETAKRITGCKSTYEMVFLRPDGERRQVLVTVTPHTNDQGQFLGALGIFRDITSIKLAEAELKRLSTAIEQASDSILVADVVGAVLYANPATEKLLGIPRDQIQGQGLADLTSGESDRAAYLHLWQAVIEGQPTSGRIRFRHADGSIGQADTTLSPVRGEEGVVQYVVVTSRDVTREAELELQLRHAQKMEAIGVLAGGIAHDFNNLLMPILGFAELAQDRVGADQPKLAGYLKEIHIAGHRAADLVSQILLFSRQAEQVKEPVELHPIVKECLKLMRATIPTTIPIEGRVDEGCGKVVADPSQIHQVIMNLCTNGYSAMRGSGGRLEVRLDRITSPEPVQTISGDLPPGDYVRLSVSDTGCGMGPQTQKQIFLPFFTTKKVGEGTGLGLSIVHGIVTGCGGGITLASEVGLGSTFTVYLPVAEPTEIEAQVSNRGVATGSERILVVDDETPIGQMLGEALEMLGYRVTVFHDSPEALAAFLAAPGAYDLLLTDYAMPGVTGPELAGRIWETRPGFPVLLMTGYADDLDEAKAVNLGFANLLRKPLPLQSLAKAVRETLDATKAGRA